MSNLIRPTNDGRTAPKPEDTAPNAPDGDPQGGATAGSAPAPPHTTTPGAARSTAATGAAAMGRPKHPEIPTLEPFTGEASTLQPPAGEPSVAEPVRVPRAAATEVPEKAPTEDLGIRQAKADESPDRRRSAADASLLDGSDDAGAASRVFGSRGFSPSFAESPVAPQAAPPSQSPAPPQRDATLRAHRPDDTGTPG